MVGRLAVVVGLMIGGASSFAAPRTPLRHSSRRQSTATTVPWLEVVEGEESPRPPPEVLALQRDLVAVRDLPRNTSVTRNVYFPDSMETIVADDKPTFRRLFNHRTWELHIGGGTLTRWWRCVRATRRSVIMRSVLPSVCGIAVYVAAILRVLPESLLRAAPSQQLPLSFCGSAIGLLLVFRTNDAYARLGEARANWGRIVHISQNVASRAAASRRHGGMTSNATTALCRYLCAYAWSLRDLLRDGDERDGVLKLLLEDAREADWVASSPNRPAALLHRMRDTVAGELCEGRISSDANLLFENDLGALGAAAADCVRIFTSPIPPTMSRHGIRSLTLWLLALPVVLAGTVPASVNVAWSTITTFVYLGIDELGVQVEQPFAIMPLWQLCQSAQDAVLGALDDPRAPLYHPRDSYVFS